MREAIAQAQDARDENEVISNHFYSALGFDDNDEERGHCPRMCLWDRKVLVVLAAVHMLATRGGWAGLASTPRGSAC